MEKYQKYSICLKVRLILPLVLLVIANPGQASVSINEEQKVSLFGDLRLRVEKDDQDRDGQTSRDRERIRVRARIGASYKPNDYWSANIRLATGAGSFNSAHMTLGTTSGSGTDFGLDRAYIQYEPNEDLDVWMGKYNLNFWQQTELVWDQDGATEGLGVAYQLGSVTFNLGYSIVEEGSWNEDMTLMTYQAVYKTGGLTLALGGVSLDNNVDTDGDTIDDYVLRSDRHIMVSGQYKLEDWRFGADIMEGNDKDEEKAYVAQVRYNLSDTSGIRLYYYYVEAFSVPGDGVLSQDNFPNPNSTGVSNFKGFRLQWDYKPSKNTSIDLRYYSMKRLKDRALLADSLFGSLSKDALANDIDRTRLQLNINVKF